jgi:hypothetical protein
MVAASLVKSVFGGNVETVFTFCTQRLRPSFFATIALLLLPTLYLAVGRE